MEDPVGISVEGADVSTVDVCEAAEQTFTPLISSLPSGYSFAQVM
jgi:hypothetical protein